MLSTHRCVRTIAPHAPLLLFLRASSSTGSAASGSQSRPPRLSASFFAVAGVLTAGTVGWYGGQSYARPTTKTAPTSTPAATASFVLPTIDSTRNYPFQFANPPSPDEVTKILTQNTWTFTTTGVPGVARCDGAHIAANGPTEDRFVYGKVQSPLQGSHDDPDWLAVGVFDGHCGSQTSDAISTSLVSYVISSIQSLGSKADDASIDQSIKQGFLALDDVFIQGAQQTMDGNASFAEKVLRLSPGSNGSCALLSLFDPSTRTLRVACTGDSRAVLGRHTADESWETVALSEDQNIRNPAEVERVKREHPGEEKTLVQQGYYMGIQPTRVFGDARQKWPIELYNEAGTRYNTNYYGKNRPRTSDVYKTPPYHTAQPEVTSIRLDTKRPAFMILATDGLWDTMSSEQAVSLVQQWIAWDKAGKPSPKQPPPRFGRFDLADDSQLLFQEKKTTVQDENVAVHLIRNALGGAHHDLISGLLAFKPPYARKVRDDITVQVVFFDE